MSAAGCVGPKIRGSSEELGRTLRILLAESNEVSQVLVTHLLEKRGHRVSVAADGAQVLAAVQDARSRDIDLLLMDTELPGMNGFEVARAIRQIEGKTGGRLPIIAMTAHPLPGEEEASRAAGMQGYLAKPVRANALFEIIERAATHREEAPEILPKMIFDRSSFMSRLEGDEQLGSEIIEMFVQECPKLLQGVRQAVEQQSAPLLERAAHALKGSLGDIGAHQAGDAARDLEMMARNGNLDDTGDALTSLVCALDRLMPELQRGENRAA